MAKLALRSNRKFRRLLARTRLDSPAHLRGHLGALWEASWENGTPLVGDLDDIEQAAEWPTANEAKYPQGAFAAALVLSGFVDTIVEGQLYAIHDWFEHAPRYVKQAIERRVKEDATVGPGTFFLGLKAWIRRAAEVGLEVDPYAEEANGARNRSYLPDSDAEMEGAGGVALENGGLSRQAKPRQAERSEETSSPHPPTPLPSPSAAPSQPDAAALWRRALGLLRETTSRPDDVATWFAPLRAESLEGRTLRLVAPNARFAHTLREGDLADELAAAVALAADRDLFVSITHPEPLPQVAAPMLDAPRARRRRTA